MKPTHHSRRDLLKFGSAAPLLGAVAPFALQMAAVSEAAGGTGTPDYKAIVCIFMLGGNDSNNTLLATDPGSWSRYFAARNTGDQSIALMPPGTLATPVGQINQITGRTVLDMTIPEAWGGVLPIATRTPHSVPGTSGGPARTFALHPMLSPLLPLYQQGRLAMLAGVGPLIQPVTKAQVVAKSAPLPANLTSHNDQTSMWQSGGVEGTRIGWGGKLGDVVLAQNGANSIYTAVGPGSSAVFLSGAQTLGYQVTNSSAPALAIAGLGTTVFGSAEAAKSLKTIVTDSSSPVLLETDYSTVTNRSINAVDTLNGAMSQSAVAAVPNVPSFTDPTSGKAMGNDLASQLRTVARIIAAAPSLGLKRQVFFVTVNDNDTHSDQNTRQPRNLAKLACAMAWFDQALSSMGGVDMRGCVTTFTASDFGRTLASNGRGTDHGWGGHHMIMGGAVKGGDIYGAFPTIGLDTPTFNNPDMYSSSGLLIPTTSVDQYGATLGRWFGASDADLNTIFPNLKNFSNPVLGFL